MLYRQKLASTFHWSFIIEVTLEVDFQLFPEPFIDNNLTDNVYVEDIDVFMLRFMIKISDFLCPYNGYGENPPRGETHTPTTSRLASS